MPVVPFVDTTQITNLVAFTAGLRNGVPYGEEDIRELVDHFERFQAIDPGTGRPFWLPYVSINHESPDRPTEYADKYGKSVGDVVAVREGVSDDGTPALIVDLDRIPFDVARDYNAGRFRSVSIEFFDPESPFVGFDGRPVNGKVLKSVSLLGAMSEASKGMPPAVAMFADSPPVRRLSSERYTAGTHPATRLLIRFTR